MKTISRLFILIAFISLSAFVSAQSFTIAELIDLAPNGEEHFKTVVTDKGYTSESSSVGAATGGMTNELTYASGNAKIIYITPNFESDVRVISYEFNSASIYDALKKELSVVDKFQLNNVENRNGGKYISHFYSRPDMDIILTCDRTVNPNGVYIVSVKYTNITKYIGK